MRKAIFHYHFFKNAGTSIDVLLKRNFPEQWVTKEFNPTRYPINSEEVKNWIIAEENAVAFSSHTAFLPVPEIPDTEIFPIVFFRHPIDRIASAYAFERIQGADTNGSILARSTTLKGYIEAQLEHSNYSQCRNFHISKLLHMFRNESGDHAELAIKAIERLPFIGVVEKYDESIQRLIAWLSPHFPKMKAISVTKNVTRDHSLPLEQKLEHIRSEIGADFYLKLLEANAGDFALYHAVLKRYT